MPVAIMEHEDTDTVSVKKKTEAGSKSILDYFKSPDKEVNLKQKGLLQFFPKQSSVNHKADNKENTRTSPASPAVKDGTPVDEKSCASKSGKLLQDEKSDQSESATCTESGTIKQKKSKNSKEKEEDTSIIILDSSLENTESVRETDDPNQQHFKTDCQTNTALNTKSNNADKKPTTKHTTQSEVEREGNDSQCNEETDCHKSAKNRKHEDVVKKCKKEKKYTKMCNELNQEVSADEAWKATGKVRESEVKTEVVSSKRPHLSDPTNYNTESHLSAEARDMLVHKDLVSVRDNDETDSNKSTASGKRAPLKGKDMMDVLKQVKHSEKKDKQSRKHKKKREKERINNDANCVDGGDSISAVPDEKSNLDNKKTEDAETEILTKLEPGREMTENKERKHRHKHKKSKLKKHKKSEEKKDKKDTSGESSTGIPYSEFLKEIENKIDENTDKEREEKTSKPEESDNSSMKEISYKDFIENLRNKMKSVETEGVTDKSNSTCIKTTTSISKKSDTSSKTGYHVEQNVSEKVDGSSAYSDDKDRPACKPVGAGNIARFFTKTSTPGPQKSTGTCALAVPKKQHVTCEQSKTEMSGNGKKKESKQTEKAESLCVSSVFPDVEEEMDVVAVSESHESDIDVDENSEIKTGKEKSERKSGEGHVSLISEEEESQQQQQTKQRLAFLTSKDSSHLATKTKQATLSFGKSGLTMCRPPVESQLECVKNTEYEEHHDNRTKTPAKDGKKTTKTPKRKKAEEKECEVHKAVKQTTDTAVVNCVGMSDTLTDDQDTSEMTDQDTSSTQERRQSLRKKYHVALFQMDVDRKTPIKIKLRRCNKSSSSGDDSAFILPRSKKLAQGNSKLTKAQALLEKAKKGKQKSAGRPRKKLKLLEKEKSSEQETTDCESENQRRSARLCGRKMASMEEVVISSSEEEEDLGGVVVAQEQTPKKKRGRKPGKLQPVSTDKTPAKSKTMKEIPTKNTPVKGTPKKNKSPVKKTGMKLAPIFMSKKQSTASPIKRPLLDPEQERQRQQFLMSGVPDELKKTVARVQTSVTLDYPTIPTVNHIQQPGYDGKGLNMWNLPEVDLKLKRMRHISTLEPNSVFMGLDCTEAPQPGLSVFKNFISHPGLKDWVDSCLTEVIRNNPAYPAYKMYQKLIELKKAVENTQSETDSGSTEKQNPASAESEVIVIEEEQTEGKKKRRRKSLKLKQKEKIKTDEQKTKEILKDEISVKPLGRSTLWTDKYQPASSAEVLGNSSCIKKLKNWLSEWKTMLDKEALKARKLLLRKNKGKIPQQEEADKIWSDDSDFDMDSEDSEEEDNSLCNTMLITGPHGSGKTCSVYGLAQELGFKVHEVNASSCRNGKRILSQLQEATQSHQVSHHGCSTPNKLTGPGTGNTPVKKLMPTTFTNLFKKMTAAETKDSQQGQQTKNKRKRELIEKDESPKKKRSRHGEKSDHLPVLTGEEVVIGKGLNLSSTTLILFDEADIVLEEDKGFLTAVQTFMATTKIPILLTTSNRTFTDKFEGRYEQIVFRYPSVVMLASHLKLICTVENLRTSHADMLDLVHLCHGDVRKSLLTLQFWAESGGGYHRQFKSLPKPLSSDQLPATAVMPIEDSQSQTEVMTNAVQPQIGDMEDDDDFVSLKPVKSKRRRLIQDDNSNSCDVFSNLISVKRDCDDEMIDSLSNTEDKTVPAVHRLCLDTVLGSCSLLTDNLTATLLSGLKDKSETSLCRTITFCEIYRNLQCSLLYTNICKLLPLATVSLESVIMATQKASADTGRGKKRKRIQNDLYDSEASNDCFEGPDAYKDSSFIENNEEIKPAPSIKAENTCLYESLKAFSDFYDTMSFVDELETQESKKDLNVIQTLSGREVRGSLQCGSEDILPNFQTLCSVDSTQAREYGSELEARGFRKLYTDIDQGQTLVETLCKSNPAFSEQFVLPVSQGCEEFSVIDKSQIRCTGELKKTEENILSNLPLCVHKCRRSITIDYLPTLREISRAEQCRYLSNTKRRFHHYFSNIGFTVKDSTMTSLASTFSSHEGFQQ